jgi:hypothetical protein
MLFAALLFLGCGTETSDDLDIQAIRDRLNMNACRINREELLFQLGELEFVNDSTYLEIPAGMLPDSLLVCPVTGEMYQFSRHDGKAVIICPSGHGESRQ